MVDDMGMAEEAIDDALVESAGYDDDNTGDENTIIQLVNQNKELEASLDEAEALIKKNAELMNGYLAGIAELEAQVTALKRIAVEERARYLEDFIHEFDPAENRSLEARRQLSEEHPEAFR